MKEKLQNLIKKALQNLKIEVKEINLEHPDDFKNGDYSTNVAMVHKINAEKIKIELEKNLPKDIQKIEIKNNFINFYLSREFFTESIKEILKQKEAWGKNKLLTGKKVMIEYTQPNPFKPFHIGHLMSNAIGESISRIVEFSGAKIIRANYQGDVGPHVAKAIYILMKDPFPTLTLNKGEGEGGGVSFLANYIGECYSKGNNLYESDENSKKEIDILNKKIYSREDKKINEIYDWGRKITLDAFEEIYKLLGTKFDKYYFESEMALIGLELIKKNLNCQCNSLKIFEKSDSEQKNIETKPAIIFKAEKFDPKLHTRVFVNSQGLPTYEAKELGLTFTKFKTSLFTKSLDLSIVTTAIEQAEYMKVVQKAISILSPDLEKKMRHITHGMMRFSEGKMSSRLGNVITGKSLLEDAQKIIQDKIKEKEFSEAEKNKIAEIVSVAALKYSILKSSTGSDIIFDFEKSISFEGNSGPYLQYTAVRANSILRKAEEFKTPSAVGHSPLSGGETNSLEKILYRFPEIVQKSYQEFAPHLIATYLTELASEFNSFYANTKILDKENKNILYHLALVKAFYQTMQNGLWLLGIQIPNKM
jgi:arginyl-tRNA synthetase